MDKSEQGRYVYRSLKTEKESEGEGGTRRGKESKATEVKRKREQGGMESEREKESSGEQAREKE